MTAADQSRNSKRFARHWQVFPLGAIAVTATLMAVVGRPYSLREFDGDGTIEENTYWSYPRYTIEFAPISLSQDGTHVFRCSGLPPEDLTLFLETIGTGDYETLRALRTRVEVSVNERDGRLVRRVDAPLCDWELSWMPANHAGSFCCDELRGLQLSRHTEYILAIAVSDVAANAAPLELRPILSGGENGRSYGEQAP
jgi:hypothetical protein